MSGIEAARIPGSVNANLISTLLTKKSSLDHEKFTHALSPNSSRTGSKEVIAHTFLLIPLASSDSIGVRNPIISRGKGDEKYIITHPKEKETTEALTLVERNALVELEETIQKNLTAFYEVVFALMQIRDKRPYSRV
jgi:hypothetical protein